eukprot:53880-Amphidinium_carterae.1
MCTYTVQECDESLRGRLCDEFPRSGLYVCCLVFKLIVWLRGNACESKLLVCIGVLRWLLQSAASC